MKPHPSRYNGAMSVFTVWKALIKLGGSCDVRETGCGYLTTIRQAKVASRLGKVTTLRRRTYYKLNRGGWSFFAFSRDAARKTNVLAV